MVDFKNENIVGRSPKELNQIIRLEKRWNLLESIEEYYKVKLLRGQANHLETYIRARLINLFFEIRGELKRSFPEKEAEQKLQEIQNKIIDEKISINEIEKIMIQFNDVLDSIGLTRIDSGRKIDYKNMEEENEAFGLD